MSKLPIKSYPIDSRPEDFECFGPVVSKDATFENCRMADFGCFKQDEGTDSNKMYHIAVVQHLVTKKWYLYCEWGRTTSDGKAVNPNFQFTEASNEREAIALFVKQCAEKNTKRGKWEKVGSKERYVPKVKSNGKTEDLYVVRYMLSRSVGLPKARTICNATEVVAVKKTPKAKSAFEPSVVKLFTDLTGGTVSYTRSVMVGSMLPSLSAIEDARDLLHDAMKQVSLLPDDANEQYKDPILRKLTNALYGMIPKTKSQGAKESDWVLTQNNISKWQFDLDAFESAVKSGSAEVVESSVMDNVPAKITQVDLKSDLGEWLSYWWKNSTRNAHNHRPLTIHNIWKVEREADIVEFNKNVADVANSMPEKWNNERPMFYESQEARLDLDKNQVELYKKSNTALLFHGTRSVNVTGIVRENLRFPNQLVGVSINGAMLGPGVYSADDWGKSANYCSTPRGALYAKDGHIHSRKSFMFAVDVCLGNPYIAPKGRGFTDSPVGYHSVFGKRQFTESRYSKSGLLLNNEWVVYKRGRIVLKYLAEVTWY